MGIFCRELKLNRSEETTVPLLNPYRGMYCIHKFYVNQTIDTEHLKFYNNQTMVLVELNLSAYREGEIDEQGIANIRRLFEKYSERRISLILRFLYDFDGDGIKNEPDSLNIIIAHMKQLSVLLKEFDKLIFIIQGLFIGSWGEMHGTRFHEKYQHIQLYKQLVESSGQNTYFAVRCPYMWRYISDTKDEQLENERLGLFNDGILGSQTDLGTYSEDGTSTSDGKNDRAQEIAFQSRICQFVPNGGEILYSELSSDKVKVLQTLKDMKISYLNSEHDLKAIEQWKNQKATLGSAAWKDKSFYDYLAEHVGYRYMLSGMTGKYYRFGRKFKYSIELSNAGMSPCYKNVEAKLVFSDDNNTCSIEAGTIKKGTAEEELKLCGTIKIPEKIIKGKKVVTVALVLTTVGSGERIVLGNVAEVKERANVIGRI